MKALMIRSIVSLFLITFFFIGNASNDSTKTVIYTFNIDEMIALIKQSPTPQDARTALLDRTWQPGLVKAMLEKMKATNGSAAQITDEALDLLQNYDYPGNIRELRNILQKSIIVSTNGLITAELLQLNNLSNIYPIRCLSTFSHANNIK